jgi:histone acetyltransferase (RNA polymerase elongator complex component)
MSILVIPIFIAHQGCPHRCIFCDQHTITGYSTLEDQPVSPGSVKEIIEQWLAHPRKESRNEVQVAFYGGSFTGLSIERQKELLGAVKPYIDNGQVNSIRISTRPDYIDGNIVALLQECSVSIVELGIQSLDLSVLEASTRGHSIEQSESAMHLLKAKGFTVGAQLMCGLPGDSTNKLMATAKRVAALAPDFVRIYPTLIIKGSGLEKIYREGEYRPLSLLKAVALSCRMKTIFDENQIRVVRMGLQPSRELEGKVMAGPYHPAFGELVISRALFKQARKFLRQTRKKGKTNLSIAAADESAFRGPNNVNMKRLGALGLLDGVEMFFDKDQARNSVLVC